MGNIELRLWGVMWLCLMVMAEKGGAYEYKVGGSGGWAVPVPNSDTYNQWAAKMRFQIGDTLVFNYQGDSVFEVTSEAYANCTTHSPISSSSDGHTVVKFSRSGPHYFISGTNDNCLKHQKLLVVVMADRTGRSPPPSGTEETTPSPAAPSSEADDQPPHKKNHSSSVVASLVASLGLLLASAIAFAF